MTRYRAAKIAPCGIDAIPRNMDTNALRRLVKRTPPVAEPVNKTSYLSTGSTQLNLACTGKSYGGFRKGTYNLLVGDSSSGKTFLSLTCLAEASINPAFDDYQLIYDPSENGAMMDFERFFGKKMADRVQPPAGTKEHPEYSTTVEEFYYNLDTALKKGPCIFIEDSMDALTTEDDDDKFDERKAAHAKKKQVTGSYGTSKPKMNSAYLRSMIPRIEKTGSILVIVTQTRDNIGFGAMFTPQTRGGGRALKFYAHLELWTSRKGTIKSGDINGKKRQIGITSLIKVKKNRHTGAENQVTVPIYHSLGIDDIGSCVSYLLEEKHWKKSGGKITAPEISEQSMTEEALCKYVDERGLKHKLRKVVAGVWHDITKKCKISRNSPYA